MPKKPSTNHFYLPFTSTVVVVLNIIICLFPCEQTREILKLPSFKRIKGKKEWKKYTLKGLSFARSPQKPKPVQRFAIIPEVGQTTLPCGQCILKPWQLQFRRVCLVSSILYREIYYNRSGGLAFGTLRWYLYYWYFIHWFARLLFTEHFITTTK